MVLFEQSMDNRMPSERSASASCIACRLRGDECVCAHAPYLRLSTRLIVIMHAKEWRRSTNTGHLARLAVKDGAVRLHGLLNQSVSSAGIDAKSASTLVLYPGRGADTLTPRFIATLPRPLTLLVPDGNWNQARKMMSRVPMLEQAHRVCLAGPTLDVECLRRNRGDERMSTFQAIAQALGALEGAQTEDRLMRFFQQVLDRMTQISMRQRRRGNYMP
jgi:DTW domain-containing protein YfiP